MLAEGQESDGNICTGRRRRTCQKSGLPDDGGAPSLVEHGDDFPLPDPERCYLLCNSYFMLNIAVSMVLADKHINHLTVFSETMDCWENTEDLGKKSKIHAFRTL